LRLVYCKLVFILEGSPFSLIEVQFRTWSSRIQKKHEKLQLGRAVCQPRFELRISSIKRSTFWN